MRQRSSWKQYAAAVGDETALKRGVSAYPQTAIALDLWARFQALEGWHYQNAMAQFEKLHALIGGSRVPHDEAENAIDDAITELLPELRDVIQVHHLHWYNTGPRGVRIPHRMSVPERARRYLNIGRQQYYDRLAAAYGCIARKLGYDGN